MSGIEKEREIIDICDRDICAAFEKRMTAVKHIAEYKKANGLPVFDPEREKEVYKKSPSEIRDDNVRSYYIRLLKKMTALSKEYQTELTDDAEKVLFVRTESAFYPVYFENGGINNAAEIFGKTDAKILVLTDDGVPCEYPQTVAKQYENAYIYTVKSGEASKSFSELEKILSFMLETGFTRSDIIINVGGGVVCDLGGFCAATYMRGIGFYNIPTTLLSCVDSSIGGKTAVNLGGIKNPVGAFYQPKGVLIDVGTLRTLPEKEISNGLAEVLKEAICFDAELFEKLENGYADIEDVIFRSLSIKKTVVEADEKESGLRRTLNFGHTVGHGIEVCSDLSHGESVAVGMIPMCGKKIKRRVIKVIEKLGLPTKVKADTESIKEAISHDKKKTNGIFSVVVADGIGKCRITEMTPEELTEKISEVTE